MDLSVNIEQQQNMEGFLTYEQELSPISKKKLFSKPRKSHNLTQKELRFPGQKILPLKHQIIPYSQVKLKEPEVQLEKLDQIRNQIITSEAQLSGQKIKRLKQMSCIQTVSENSKNDLTSEENSELQMNLEQRPPLIHSAQSSPISSKHFKCTFSSLHQANMNKSFLTTNSFHKNIPQNKSPWMQYPEMTKTLKYINNSNLEDNGKKSNKISLSKRNLNINNLMTDRQVYEVKICQFQKAQDFFTQRNQVCESFLVFDEDKFLKYDFSLKSVRNKLQPSGSAFDRINKQILNLLQQQQEAEKILKTRNLKINNQNLNYSQIVKDINSYRIHKPPSPLLNNFYDLYLRTPLTPSAQSNKSSTTSKQERRIHSVESQFYQLKASENIFSSINKTPTKDLNHPKQIQEIKLNLNQFSNTNQNVINLRGIQKNHSFLNEENKDKMESPNSSIKLQGYSSRLQKAGNLFTKQQVEQIREKRSIQKNQQRNEPQRRSGSKGITVVSKQKHNKTESINSNKFGTLKLKSLNQIKNMKKLKIQTGKARDNNR